MRKILLALLVMAGAASLKAQNPNVLGPVTLTGTPTAGNLIVATSPTAATWQAPSTAISVQFDTSAGTCSVTVGTGSCTAASSGGYLGGAHVVITDNYGTTTIARNIEGVQTSSGSLWGSGSATGQFADIKPSANSVDVTFAGTSLAGTLTDSLPAMGPSGTPATVAVGTTTTLGAGVSATVANSGTTNSPIFNFGIPQGIPGTNGTSSTQDHNILFLVTQAGQIFAGQTAGACTITGWSLIGDVSGSATVEIDAHASSAPPAVPAIPNTTTDKITASAPLTISAAQSASGGVSAVSTWTTARTIWDSFAVNVTAFSGFGRLNGTVFCQ